MQSCSIYRITLSIPLDSPQTECLLEDFYLRFGHATITAFLKWILVVRSDFLSSSEGIRVSLWGWKSCKYVPISLQTSFGTLGGVEG